ncbi:hypothetical protein B0H17DRAFT_1192037 [Mycena rosella]|uniref:F-box domain-containing protein n=1 Tax=Mycena rosella TaxID=1033263 RepID=A0AAD7GXM0_MYCRO|nr:hypothetical protein B0H17DRAFT_1192037 [Mycena rosella]
MLHTLPLELATEICAFACPETLSDPHPSHAPLLLTHVCQDWRRITHSIPRLWSELTLSYDHVGEPPTVLIEQWLRRAKLVSLSLWLGTSLPQEIIPVISRHSAKWKALEFHVGPTIHELAEINPIGGFPSLARLVVRSSQLSDPPARPTEIDAFNNAPLLRELYFGGTPAQLKKLVVPWSQLTTYACTRMGVAEVLAVLAKTPNLVHCRLTTSTANPSAVLMSPLQHLKTLTFPLSSRLHILANLTLPELQSLDVGLPQEDDIETLLAFLGRSSCKLLHFSACARDTPAFSFYPCLRAMPTLSSLRLVITPFAEIASLFEVLGEDQSLLPALEYLIIVSEGRMVFNYDDLLAMLSARSSMDGCVSVRRIALHWTSEPDPEFFPTPEMHSKLIVTGVSLHIGPDPPMA